LSPDWWDQTERGLLMDSRFARPAQDFAGSIVKLVMFVFMATQG
jgi:hypothetical protein